MLKYILATVLFMAVPALAQETQPPIPPTLTLTLTAPEIGTVWAGLMKLPAERSFEVLIKVREQVEKQSKPAPAVR